MRTPTFNQQVPAHLGFLRHHHGGEGDGGAAAAAQEELLGSMRAAEAARWEGVEDAELAAKVGGAPRRAALNPLADQHRPIGTRGSRARAAAAAARAAPAVLERLQQHTHDLVEIQRELYLETARDEPAAAPPMPGMPPGAKVSLFRVKPYLERLEAAMEGLLGWFGVPSLLPVEPAAAAPPPPNVRVGTKGGKPKAAAAPAAASKGGFGGGGGGGAKKPKAKKKKR